MAYRNEILDENHEKIKSRKCLSFIPKTEIILSPLNHTYTFLY